MTRPARRRWLGLRRRYADGDFVTNTTNVSLARPAVAVMRQQPSVGKVMPLAQKCGAPVKPSLIDDRVSRPGGSMLEPEILKWGPACRLPHQGNLIFIEPSGSTNSRVATIFPSG